MRVCLGRLPKQPTHIISRLKRLGQDRHQPHDRNHPPLGDDTVPTAPKVELLLINPSSRPSSMNYQLIRPSSRPFDYIIF